MASRAAHIDHLKQIPLFAVMSKKDLQLIAKGSDEIKMAAGTMLIDQGQTGREAFIILSGSVIVKRNGRKITTLSVRLDPR